MSSFEKALVYHCSPTLCGLKPANLLSLSKDEYPHLPQLAAAYARLLEDKGIRLTMSSDFAAIKAKAASCADIGRCTATWTMQNGALPPLTAAAMHCTPACCPVPLWNSWCPLPNLLPE